MIALLYVGLATGSLVWAVSPTFPVAHCHHIRTLVLFAVHTPCSFDALIALGLKALLTSDGKILFSEDLSKKILAKADGLGALLGGGKQIALPLHFGGTAGSPSITPDLRALSGAAKQELKNRAAKELGDAIFGKRKADDGAQQNSDRDSAEGLIREGLGRFLGR